MKELQSRLRLFDLENGSNQETNISVQRYQAILGLKT